MVFAIVSRTVLQQLDGLDVEVPQLVRLQVLLDEPRQVEEARLEHLDRVARLRADFGIVPDACVQYLLVLGFRAESLLVTWLDEKE